MPRKVKRYRLLCLSLGVLSLWLATHFAPVRAAAPTATPLSVSQRSAASSNHWLDQGRNFYQAGRFAEAALAWEKAVEQSQTQGDRAQEALSWSYLSVAQQELHQWSAAQRSIETSLTLLQTIPADAIVWAQVLNTQANLQLQTGQAETALATWQQAQKFYEQSGDIQGSLGTQINQAQALQHLGFYRRSKQQLDSLSRMLNALPDDEIKLSGLRSLGIALQSIGDLAQSQQTLQQSLAIARQIDAKTQLSSLLLNLGQITANLSDPNGAFEYLTQAEQAALNAGDRTQADLALFKLFLDYDKPELTTSLAPQLLKTLKESPPSHSSLYAAIHFVAAINGLDNPSAILPLNELSQLLEITVQSARQIQDTSAQAYALHQWGQLYRRTQQSSEAQALTQKSLELARQLQAEDIIAQSAWQLGQLYRQQGKQQDAIAAYSEAVNALKAMRGDLVAINPEVQFSFRESVEPVYRELVDLLLDQQPTQASLAEARELIEALQIAELDNFFREACLDKAQQIDQVDPTATIVYPIILPNRLATIFSQAGKPLRYYVTDTAPGEVQQTLNNLLAALNPVSDGQERDRLSQKVYDWLIRPAESDRLLKDTQTLVFVLDGQLRNIPIAALYDGQRYLIEKYAVALSPGLQVMAGRSHNNFSALIGGISESRSGFSALPEVEAEVKEISEALPSALLLNQAFTNKALAERLQSKRASIVHLATHGQFSSRIEDTFLLTWDGQVSVRELSELLENRGGDPSKAIELLVLSACDTAAGDDRAVLGLAGLAVKSGARSTLATLWPVKDRAAALLMARFYDQLRQPNLTKAEALRQAQIHLIRQTDFRDPFFWSGFVLVGNWV